MIDTKDDICMPMYICERKEKMKGFVTPKDIVRVRMFMLKSVEHEMLLGIKRANK